MQNCQHTRQIGDLVVALHGRAGRRDGISADLFARFARNRVEDQTFGIAVSQTGDGGGQFRICRAMHFLLVIGHHHSGGRGDGEGAWGGRYLVVRIVVEGNGDGVGADILAGLTGKRVVDDIVADGTRHSGGERRVGIAVGFTLVVGSYRGSLLVDGEVAADRCQVVVGIIPLSDSDGVGANIFAGLTGKCVVDDIIADGARHRGGEIGIGRAVGLAVFVGSHRGGSFVDGEDAVGGHHRVVRVVA